jgi:predicted alpha/beta hydrolase
MATEQSGFDSTSIFLPFKDGDQLHMRRFSRGGEGIPVLLLHGSIESGRIFYSESGKGFAPWLAQQGYDVFVADMRGRGRSTPAVSRASNHGADELMEEEIPTLLRGIHAVKGVVPIHFVAHSWGGVDFLAYLARPAYPVTVHSMAFFGTKRHISVRNLRYYWMVGLGWNILSPLIIRRRGFLDAVRYRMGSDNISGPTFFDTNHWVRSKDWIHWKDGFDYPAAFAKMQLPPVLYLAGQNDHVLGHPVDVQRLADETGQQNKKIQILGRAHGHRHDYGHIDMLTHRDAAQDVFPMVRDWMRQHEPLTPTHSHENR